jgi:hypothetical protein
MAKKASAKKPVASARREKATKPIRTRATAASKRPAATARQRRVAAGTPAKVEHKAFEIPDEVRTFEKGRLELLKIGGGVVGRLTLKPGWRWSQHVKHIAGTEWCEAPHFQYQLSGKLHVAMADGIELETGAGDVSALPSGHDAWVVGYEAVVLIDWSGATKYAKQ